MATKAVKAGETLRAVVAEVERPRGEAAVVVEEVARLRAALVVARATLMGHGFDVAYIDAVLT